LLTLPTVRADISSWSRPTSVLVISFSFID
jgi:hypothetical protein